MSKNGNADLRKIKRAKEEFLQLEKGDITHYISLINPELKRAYEQNNIDLYVRLKIRAKAAQEALNEVKRPKP